MKKISINFIYFALISMITGCATTNTAPVASAINPVTNTYINQYPTRDLVDYVLNCVAKHGGLTYISQYACGCKIDKVAEKLSFKEFEAATTFSYLRKTPGENGSAFRDPKQSKSLRKRLQEAELYAEKMCFVK